MGTFRLQTQWFDFAWLSNVTVYWNINQVSFIKEHGMDFPRRHEQTSAHRWIIGGSRGRQKGHMPLPPPPQQIGLTVVYSLNFYAESSDSNTIITQYFYTSKTIYPHCCSRPRCLNGYPVGCKWYDEYVFACNAMIGSWQGMLPWEWKLCTVRLVWSWICIQWPG